LIVLNYYSFLNAIQCRIFNYFFFYSIVSTLIISQFFFKLLIKRLHIVLCFVLPTRVPNPTYNILFPLYIYFLTATTTIGLFMVFVLFGHNLKIHTISIQYATAKPNIHHIVWHAIETFYSRFLRFPTFCANLQTTKYLRQFIALQPRDYCICIKYLNNGVTPSKSCAS
jgi:hypothetical protein